ncbi:MAG: CvpA family protein [Clostridia bacterium]|nr:CvpA family protein [Clostridia bacterium]
MSICDIVILAVLALAAVIGFFKGILKTVLRFAELILCLGLGALAGMAMIWLKFADMEMITEMVSSGDFSNAMESGALYVVIAFAVMFVVSFIVCDYFTNRIIYSRKTKKVIADRIIGLFVNLILWIAILLAAFAVISSLEGTEYDFYTELSAGGSFVSKIFLDYNPLNKPLGGLMRESGVTKIIITILNMVWPNFEYLA